jgi:hypothetical protein
MSIDDVKPGQVGIGRTVFAGETIEEFKVNILGVLRNIIGPKRDLILARLEGGPLATTGVIQGRAAAPWPSTASCRCRVYALGIVCAGQRNYAIAEMIDAVDNAVTRLRRRCFQWPATRAEVFATSNLPTGPPQRCDLRATSAFSAPPTRRPGAVTSTDRLAMVVSGLDPHSTGPTPRARDAEHDESDAEPHRAGAQQHAPPW